MELQSAVSGYCVSIGIFAESIIYFLVSTKNVVFLFRFSAAPQGVDAIYRSHRFGFDMKPRRKHLFRQDLQDYQDFFGLVYLSCPSS